MISRCMSLEDLPVYLSVDQLAALLGISRAGAYTYVHTDGFPLLRIGKRMLVPRDQLIAWLDAQTEGAV
ncbi:MAG: helix-turn-helix domain-containing protein [Oscillospiraceae bacterium]|nr:helix-turn-helix domain-containing protein [Oscillospiraceae bacterium]